MRKVNGSEVVNLFLDTGYGSRYEEQMTLSELGWDGQQGEELTAFMEKEYREWAWNHLDGAITFADED